MAGGTLDSARESLGVYLHVPFCRVHCPYCDFYTYPAGRGRAPAFTSALVREIELASERLIPSAFVVETVYFGGGTPSTLAIPELAAILGALKDRFELGTDCEITLEANPEDVTPEALAAWRSLGITRFSLGVQTFDPDRLAFLGRLHSAERARRSLSLLAGSPNWSADLMFGWADQSVAELEHDLGQLLAYAPPHVSLYQLTFEPQTRLGVLAAQHRLALSDSDRQADLYLAACDRLEQAGLVLYEVSNYSRPGFESRHNRSYWQRRSYLGLGPSAASLLAERRTRNLASLPGYLERLARGRLPLESVEVLTPETAAMERLWLGLRTSNGVSLDLVPDETRPLVQRAESDGLVATAAGSRIVLTRKGMALADEVAARFLPTGGVRIGAGSI